MSVHHIELWVADFGSAQASWGWLLGELGWTSFQEWPGGRSWRSGAEPGAAYLCIEESSDLLRDVGPDRRRVGLNHLALHARQPSELDALVAAAPAHGWAPMFADRYPHAGGPDQYAAYLENADGFEVELVAAET